MSTAAPQLSATVADRTIYGDAPGSGIGFRVVVADLMVGGADEIAFSAPDHVNAPYDTPGYVGVLNPDAVMMSEASVLWIDESSLGVFGYRLGAHDLDGDGHQDLLVGSPRDIADLGRLDVLWGPIEPAPVGPLSEDSRVVDLDPAGSVGAFAFLDDWDGDGVKELAVGARHGVLPGAVRVFDVTRDLPLDESDAELTVVGPDLEFDAFGMVLAAADLDADGALDLVTGDYREEEVRVFSAGSAAEFTDAWATIEGSSGLNFGSVLTRLGDLDGDTVDELGVGYPMDTGVLQGLADEPQGRGIVLGSPLLPGTHTTEDFEIQIPAEANLDNMGSSFASGDFDDDGVQDLAISAPGYPYGLPGPGKVYLFLGPITGPLAPENAALVLVGVCSLESFGFGLDAGDVDGDGRDDLVVGAPSNHEGAEYAGAIYVFEGPTLFGD